jgi:hypothetical protein
MLVEDDSQIIGAAVCVMVVFGREELERKEPEAVRLVDKWEMEPRAQE